MRYISTILLISSLLIGTALSALAAVEGSFEAVSGTRCVGWAHDTDRPTQKLIVEFSIDKANSAKPAFVSTTGPSRGDANRQDQGRTVFETVIPGKLRDGKEHLIYAAVRDADGKLVMLPGSPRKASFTKVVSVPKITIKKAMAPIPTDAIISIGGVAAADKGLAPLATKSSEMSWVLGHSQMLHVPIGVFRDAPMAQLKAFKEVVAKYKLQLVVEMAGISQWMQVNGDQMGKTSAEQELEWMANYTKPESQGGAGGVVDVAMFDDPLYRCLYPNERDENRTVAFAANQIADAMIVWQARFPNIKIILGTNFPNWGWKGTPAYYNLPMKGKYGRGDYYPVLIETLNVLKQRGKSLYGVMVDNPADYAQKIYPSNQPEAITKTDFIKRALELEKVVKQNGLKYAMWINTDIQDIEPDGTFDMPTRDKMYYEHISRYAQLYRSLGGEPDMWVTFSWMKSPSKMGPETQPYTQTWNSKQLIMQLRGIK